VAKPVSSAITLTQAKSLIRALHGEVHARPSFWFMRQAGRYLPEYRAIRAQAPDFVSLCLNPDLASEITLQPIRRFGMDAAILFADILLVPHALGQSLVFREGEGPVLEPVRSAREVAKLAGELEHVVTRLAPVLETVRLVAHKLPLDTALIGFAGAPWTVATYMVEGGTGHDFNHVRRWAYGDPDSFQQLIDLLVDATVRYLAAQIDAGAEAVQLFDTWAGTLSEAAFQRWCIAPIREIAAQLRLRRPAVPIIAFPKGAGVHYHDFAALTGVTAIGLDSGVPAAWAASALQRQATIQGNLDPLLVAIGGRPMAEGAAHILGTLGKGPFVFNLGHGILPETPPDNVGRLCDFIRRWRN
jgi:uroporphyrinogen decarboxylase